ncbi:MAG TPA: hypothetical protein VM925_01720, partial [Labilithrix sp.]|nr:hypothetical protein [Labilithrix sp.]
LIDLEQGVMVKHDLLHERASTAASIATNLSKPVRLRLWRLQLDVEAPNGARLPPALELIYRLAVDVGEDEADLDPPAPLSPPRDHGGFDAPVSLKSVKSLPAPALLGPREAWSGFELRHGQIRRAWPGVTWTAALDRELLFRAWNELAVQAAHELQGAMPVANAPSPAPPPATPQAVVDALAFQYVQSVCEIGRSRRAPALSWSLGPSDRKHWSALIEPYISTDVSTHIDGQRWIAFRSFLEHLPLLAAPEAGLSAAAADDLLAALPRGITIDDRALQEARRALVVVDTNQPDEDRVLAEIDAQHPAHPFVVRFGRHGRAG